MARTRTDGVKTCRIHDLLRDLCISESKEEKFLKVCSDFNLLHGANTADFLSTVLPLRT